MCILNRRDVIFVLEFKCHLRSLNAKLWKPCEKIISKEVLSRRHNNQSGRQYELENGLIPFTHQTLFHRSLSVAHAGFL